MPAVGPDQAAAASEAVVKRGNPPYPLTPPPLPYHPFRDLLGPGRREPFWPRLAMSLSHELSWLASLTPPRYYCEVGDWWHGKPGR